MISIHTRKRNTTQTIRQTFPEKACQFTYQIVTHKVIRNRTKDILSRIYPIAPADRLKAE